jgi:hypothetical protein
MVECSLIMMKINKRKMDAYMEREMKREQEAKKRKKIWKK